MGGGGVGGVVAFTDYGSVKDGRGDWRWPTHVRPLTESEGGRRGRSNGCMTNTVAVRGVTARRSGDCIATLNSYCGRRHLFITGAVGKNNKTLEARQQK